MKVKTVDAELGVIIGRFQIHDLHEGHRALIDAVRAKHKKVLVLLGSTPGVLVTRNNPLDYYTRMIMLRDAYPDLIILPIGDMPSDKDWSDTVDQRIEDVLGVGSAVLYGSRDAFIPYYHGKYPTVELEEASRISATEVRSSISDEVRASSDFRRGVIYAAHNRHKVVYQTVDIAIMLDNDTKVILGRKRTDPTGDWRFPGGFVDPTKDDSLEAAARREACEEVLCDSSRPEYIGSKQIEDWRYKKESDKIMTAFFICRYHSGIIKAGDDLEQVRAFTLIEANSLILPQHMCLMNLLNSHLKKEKR